MVMHFTTGTQISSTINEFTQNTGKFVSTHLVIGRDGRVIQFVPFDKSAHHVGFGYWEGQHDLNRLSIGIELDNAGYLKNVNGQWLRKKTVIDPSNVEEAIHWKESRKRGWEKFTPVQLKVALDIVKVLVQHYNLQDILGHDMLNLVNRLDPGPLFPIEDWREEIFGRREPAFKPFEINQEAEIFANPRGEPPILTHPQFNGKLPEKSIVKVLDTQGVWALVKVLASKKGGFAKKTGWILAASIRHAKKADKTTVEQEMFIKLPGKASPPPPLKLKGSPLPAGTRVRIQEARPEWTLVFVLPTEKIRWMEGWVKSAVVQTINPD
jgi:N-acetylmuramoyl-L-alanine amidase